VQTLRDRERAASEYRKAVGTSVYSWYESHSRTSAESAEKVAFGIIIKGK
jgi:hypothetical protein